MNTWWRKKKKYINLARALTVNTFVPSAPFLRIIPTDRCNLKCRYCWQRRDESYEMTEEEFLKYLEKAKELNTGVLSFLGGEPMIWKPLCTAVSACTKQNLLTDITTNGTLLNEQTITALGEAGLDYLNISVDGIKANDITKKDSVIRRDLLDILMSAQKKYRMRFRINAVLYKNNIEDVKQLVEEAGTYRVPITIGYVVPPLEKTGDEEDIYFSHDDRELLEDIIGFLKQRRGLFKGYRIVDPQPYFENVFRFLDHESFWECNYPKRFGWINVTPDGRLRSCTKKMDELDIHISDLDRKGIKKLKTLLKEKVEKCNPHCYSNCAYTGYYYLNHKIKAFTRMLLERG